MTMRVLRFELKRLFNSRIISVIIVFLALSVPIIQSGISKYQIHKSISKEFLEFQNRKVKNNIESINNGFLGLYIFKFRLQPSPLCSLFSSSFDCLETTIDNTGIILENNSPTENKILSNLKTWNKLDLSSYILIVFSILVSLFGFFDPDIKKTRFLLNFSNSRNVYLQKILSKSIYIFLVLVVLMLIIFIQFMLNGIRLSHSEIIVIFLFFLMSIIVMLFFLVFAIFSSTFRIRPIGFFIMLCLWVFSVFVMYCGVNFFSDNHKIKDSIYNHTIKKDNKLRSFENHAIKTLKNSLNREETYNKLKEECFRNVQSIKELDDKRIETISRIIEKKQFVDIFTPFSFYGAVCDKISSMGLQSFCKIYKHCSLKQNKIIDLYLKKTTNTKNENKIKNPDFNPIYKSKSNIPTNFLTGFIFNLFVLLVFLFLVYFKFKRSIFPKIKTSFKDIKINTKKGDYALIKLEHDSESFSSKLFNVCFTGEKLEGKINDLENSKVFYLPGLPYSYTKNLSILSQNSSSGSTSIKSLKSLTFDELLELLPKIKTSDILLLDEIDINIKPNKDILILELNSTFSFKNHTNFFLINKIENEFKVAINR